MPFRNPKQLSAFKTVQIGLLPHLSVDRVQSHLKAKLQRNLTPSAILRAIRTIALGGANINVENADRPPTTAVLKDAPVSERDSVRQRLATVSVILAFVCVLLLLLIVAVLLRGCTANGSGSSRWYPCRRCWYASDADVPESDNADSEERPTSKLKRGNSLDSVLV